jgi:hypothetical protein
VGVCAPVPSLEGDSNASVACEGTNACNGAGVCLLAPGQTCTFRSQCASGQCAGTCQ